MVRKSANYNPETYGPTMKCPEGNHLMTVVASSTKFSPQNEEQWEIELETVDPRYRGKFAMKCWLPVDGCVEALFDAGGFDPASISPDKDYQPEMFISSIVTAEVFHKPGKKTRDDGSVSSFANVRKLTPVFTRNAQSSASTQPAQQQPANPNPPVAEDDVPW